MSSSVFAALPASAAVFQYDADGDAIMTDAATGLPIRFTGRVRARSESSDDESADTRPSKRSRSSSDEDGAAAPAPRRGSTGTLIASPLAAGGAAAAAPLCPPAPKKAPVGPSGDDEDGDGAESAARNLAEAMAEAVLHGEPRDGDANPAPVPSAPPAGDGPVDAEEEGWCLSVKVSDLALRLDMRHPRVVLNLLRFVETYNELAPEGEEIHMPFLPEESVEHILSHESVLNPAPEFAAEVAELRALVSRYSCHCADCNPEDDDEGDRRSYSSEESYRSGRYYD